METEKELILTVGNAHTALARIVELAVSVGIYIDNISFKPELNDHLCILLAAKFVKVVEVKNYRNGS